MPKICLSLLKPNGDEFTLAENDGTKWSVPDAAGLREFLADIAPMDADALELEIIETAD